ncbi:DUF924 family protein [Aestuariivirga sp.]|uniref:DUF924 family protein n=1 Tax=Aestuariivirga sp. TaxID=2650926 RepID=UPI003919A73E
MTPQEVTRFWEEAGPSRWFFKDAAFDGALKVRFGDALVEARQGRLDHWGETPEGALGLVILLDQVSRNVHRGSPLAFAADARALRLARGWIGQGFHYRLPAPRASWLIMPYEHSEDLDTQHRCVGLFQAMGLTDMVYWAKVHLDIIARFGRFPHRNPVLGRVSTPDELTFLRAGGFSG